MEPRERIPVGRVGALVTVNVVAVAGLVVYATATASSLPARYPVHFNFAGHPDRWATGVSLTWYLPPLVAAVTGTLLVALALLLPRLPLSLINIPHKAQFLRLEPARQAAILQSVIRMALRLSVANTVMMFAVQWLMFRSALDGEVKNAGAAVGGLAVVYCALILVGSLHVSLQVKRATDR